MKGMDLEIMLLTSFRRQSQTRRYKEFGITNSAFFTICKLIYYFQPNKDIYSLICWSSETQESFNRKRGKCVYFFNTMQNLLFFKYLLQW